MTRRKNVRKWLWWGGGILIVLVIAVVVLVKNNIESKSSNQQTMSENTVDEKKEETSGSDDLKDSKDVEVAQKEEKAPQYEGESPNNSGTLTGLVTYADVANDELVIRVNIDQFLQTGTCNIRMSRNGATYYTGTVAIIESVTTSTCDGFKIPVSELPSGDLQIEIDLESEGKSGKITSRVRI